MLLAWTTDLVCSRVCEEYDLCVNPFAGWQAFGADGNIVGILVIWSFNRRYGAYYIFLTPFVKIKYKHRAERQQRLRQAKHVTCQNTFPANFPPPFSPLDTPLLSLIHPRHPFSPITEYKHFCFPKSFLTFHI